jgi:2-dehydro-3-deoxyphosphogluconate aldolase/(4S)-4-hydroxy-2-oxoglutarate aldolase
MKQINIIDQIKIDGVLPLFFNSDIDTCKSVLQYIYDSGIRCLEFTNRGEAALDNFTHLVEYRNQNCPDLLLGIGTIKNIETAKRFITIGADFIVSPGLVPEVVSYCTTNHIVCIPGCMTPSEIMLASSCGATMIKLFPGNVLGPGFMQAVKEVFPELSFMPTGGVDLDPVNIKKWIDAGVIALGMGSKLISKEIIQNQNWQLLKDNITLIKDYIKQARS